MSSFLHTSRSENTNNIVTIDLSNHPPNAKLGMLLAPGSLPTPIFNSGSSAPSSPAPSLNNPTASNVTLVAGWEHCNQQLGPIQRSGMVRLGDRLVRINGRDVTEWTFREVMDVLKEMITTANNTTIRRKRRLTTLGFAPSGTDEWSRGVILGGEEFNSTSMLFGLFQSQESKVSPHVISKRLYSFVSFVGRWRVVDEEVDASATAAASNTARRQTDQQQQQQRQISENSTDLLEAQLNKEPSMKFDNDGPIDIPSDPDEHDEINDSNNDAAKKAITTTNNNTTPSIFSSEAEAEWHKEITQFQQQNNRPPSKTKKKKIVQYELHCHLLLRRDPNSTFKSSPNKSSHHGGIMNKNNNIHHSWSVWKRYSEFQTLDLELRNTFGWQMDAIDDGKGIIFPSVHGLESWWYGWRNGGGYLTSLMGGSYGVVEVDNDAGRVDEEEADNGRKKDRMKKADNGGSNGIFGFSNCTDESDSNNNPSTSTSSSTKTPPTTTTCPYPKPFIEKRQKELSAYWVSLSRVEDIFEFSDVNSHRFGALMASFLEVDQVLLSRRSSNSRAAASNQSRCPQPTTPVRLTEPVIHENETELYSFGARKSEQWQSTPTRDLSGITFNDDDVSMLSDGTGANAYLTSLQNSYSPAVPARGRLLVDNVPTQFTSNHPLPLSAENKSVSSRRSVSSKSTKRVGGSRGASRKAKPAFQRQFMD